MKIFSVYHNDNLSIKNAVFISEGFSVKAFVFTYLWSLFNRLWVFTFIALALHVFFISALYNIGATPQIISFTNLLISFYIGFSANQWKEATLIKNGYKLTEIVAAKNLSCAQLKFFDNYLEKDNNQ